MIIITNGDFSQNNVGKIVINKTIAPEVQAISTAYGGLTTTKINALQDFYDEMVSAGLWSSLDKAYLPFLATSINKTFLNLKNNTVDWEPSALIYELNALGIKATNPLVSDTSKITWTGLNINVTFSVYLPTTKTISDFANASYTDLLALNNSNNNELMPFLNMNSGELFLQGNVGGDTSNYSANKGVSNPIKGLYTFAIGDAGTYVNRYVNSSLLPNGTFATRASKSLTELRPFRNNNSHTSAKTECAIYALFNKKLSQTEMTTWYMIVKKIVDAVLY